MSLVFLIKINALFFNCYIGIKIKTLFLDNPLIQKNFEKKITHDRKILEVQRKKITREQKNLKI